MLKAPLRLLILTALICGANYLVYRHASSDAAGLESRRDAAKAMGDLIAAAVPIPKGRPTVVLGNLEADFNGMVSDQLYYSLEKQDAVVRPLVPAGRFLPRAIVPAHGRATEGVLQLAQFAGADYAIVGRVTSWKLDNKLEVQVSFISVASRTVDYEHTFTIDSGRSESTP